MLKVNHSDEDCDDDEEEDDDDDDLGVSNTDESSEECEADEEERRDKGRQPASPDSSFVSLSPDSPSVSLLPNSRPVSLCADSPMVSLSPDSASASLSPGAELFLRKLLLAVTSSRCIYSKCFILQSPHRLHKTMLPNIYKTLYVKHIKYIITINKILRFGRCHNKLKTEENVDTNQIKVCLLMQKPTDIPEYQSVCS